MINMTKRRWSVATPHLVALTLSSILHSIKQFYKYYEQLVDIWQRVDELEELDLANRVICQDPHFQLIHYSHR